MRTCRCSLMCSPENGTSDIRQRKLAPRASLASHCVPLLQIVYRRYASSRITSTSLYFIWRENMRFRAPIPSSDQNSLASSACGWERLFLAVNSIKVCIAKQGSTESHPNFYAHAKMSLLILGLFLCAASTAHAQACSTATPSGTTITCVQSAWGYQNFSSATVTAGSTSTGSGAPTFSSSPVAGHVLAVFTAANLTFTSITDTCNALADQATLTR